MYNRWVFPPPVLKHLLVKLDHPRISMGTLPCLKKQVDFSFKHIKVSIHWMIAISQNAARLTLRYFSKGSMMSKKSTVNLIWLVVSTHLKNISQIGSFLQVRVKIKKCLKPPPSDATGSEAHLLPLGFPPSRDVSLHSSSTKRF